MKESKQIVKITFPNGRVQEVEVNDWKVISVGVQVRTKEKIVSPTFFESDGKTSQTWNYDGIGIGGMIAPVNNPS